MHIYIYIYMYEPPRETVSTTRAVRRKSERRGSERELGICGMFVYIYIYTHIHTYTHTHIKYIHT